jgi:hypothetical protein
VDSRQWQLWTQDTLIFHRGTPTLVHSALMYCFPIWFAIKLRGHGSLDENDNNFGVEMPLYKEIVHEKYNKHNKGAALEFQQAQSRSV